MEEPHEIVEKTKQRLGGTLETVDEDREMVWSEIEKLQEQMREQPAGSTRVALREQIAALNRLLFQLHPDYCEPALDISNIEKNIESSPWQLDKSHSSRFLEDFVYTSQDGTWKLRIEQGSVDIPETLGRTVWDGSLVLSRFLESRADEFLKGKRVVEICAGCGITGMVAARLTNRHHDVVLTDLPNVLDQLRFNCLSNDLLCPVMALAWGASLSAELEALGRFDVILGADVL